jgi:uncharacterized membrane protein YraQ (UPF0718 family)
VAALALLFVFRVQGTPPAVLSTFSTRFLGIFLEAVPFLLLGSVVSGLIEVYASPTAINRFIPKNRVLAAATGALMGFAFPVCECGAVPVARRMFTKGVPISVGVAFLLASPVMNPIVLASTWTAFGPGPVLLGRYLITAVVATSVALIFTLATRPSEVLRASSLVAVSGGATGVLPARTGAAWLDFSRIRTALALASDDFFDMGRYLVAGTMLAAAMQTLISQDFLTSLGQGPVVSVVTMQVLAYVLSICSTVDAFLALAFAGTFTTGAILAFLTFGPMVDVKSTFMFLGVFRPRAVAYLILLPLLMTMLFGVWLNLNLAP